MEQTEVQKIISMMQNEDPQLVRKAFGRALTELKSHQETREQARIKEIQNKTLEELDQLLKRTSPTEKTYDAILENRRQKLNAHFQELNKPTPEELEQAALEHTNLQNELQNVGKQINELQANPSGKWKELNELSNRHRALMVQLGQARR